MFFNQPISGHPIKRPDVFTESEKKIIALFAKDKLVKEIAAELFLGNRTVERYKANIMEKMGVKTTAGIVVYAIKNKLIILDDCGVWGRFITICSHLLCS